jgi:hypothetical protein
MVTLIRMPHVTLKWGFDLALGQMIETTKSQTGAFYAVPSLVDS